MPRIIHHKQFCFLFTFYAVVILSPSWIIGCANKTSQAGFLTGDEAIQEAFLKHRSDLLVESSGTVERTLPDDIEGSRHQLFVVRLATGQTLLIAHNIDIAPRIADIRIGDTVSFRGEYKWNDKGGVVHWTHRDPQMRHPHGWLEHNGQRYQ